MTKTIQSYQEFLNEKQRLETLLRVQKEELHRDIRELKEELRPVTSALSFAGKLATRDKGNLLLNAGANTLINLVVYKLFLSRAGWVTKLVVPLLIKNYSSHAIADKKEPLLNKLFSWIKKKRANGREDINN